MTDATQPRMARGRLLSAGVLVAALFALLAFAPIASATPDPVNAGKTKLTLNKNWTNYLKTFGIGIQKIGKATYNGKQASFPIYEGTMDPANGLGRWQAAGGLKFKNGKKGAPVKGLELRTNGGVMVGKVAGKKMQIAKMVGWNYSRNGFGVAIKVKKFKLTKGAANALNKATGYPKGKPKPFIAGKVIGSSYSNVQPATVAIEASNNEVAYLALAPQALAKLQHVGIPGPFGETPPTPVSVALAPVAPTTFEEKTLTAGFPIGGGNIGRWAEAGTIVTGGGLKLVQNLEIVGKGVTTLTMGNIWLDLGAKTASVEVIIENPAFPLGEGANLGNLGRASIADINLEGATIISDPAARTVTVENAFATLQGVTAATLNQVFIEGLEEANPVFKGQEKFAEGDPLGMVSFTVHTQ